MSEIEREKQIRSLMEDYRIEVDFIQGVIETNAIKRPLWWSGFDCCEKMILDIISNSRFGNEDIAYQIQDKLEEFKDNLLNKEPTCLK